MLTPPRVGADGATDSPSLRTVATNLSTRSATSYMASDAGHADADADADDGDAVPGRPCPFCGASMVHRHCKYVCPEHGVVYDCSDTFY